MASVKAFSAIRTLLSGLFDIGFGPEIVVKEPVLDMLHQLVAKYIDPGCQEFHNFFCVFEGKHTQLVRILALTRCVRCAIEDSKNFAANSIVACAIELVEKL